MVVAWWLRSGLCGSASAPFERSICEWLDIADWHFFLGNYATGVLQILSRDRPLVRWSKNSPSNTPGHNAFAIRLDGALYGVGRRFLFAGEPVKKMLPPFIYERR